MIYNKKEYKAYIRSLFTNGSVAEFEQYESEMKDSDNRRKMLRKSITEMITRIKTEQDQTILAQLSDSLEQMRRERAETVPHNQLLLSRFSVLSDGAKKYACASALLNKYLTLELVKHNPLQFPTMENGDIIVDIIRLKESHLHKLATSVCDFIHNYMKEEAQKVTHANYFLDIYTSVPTIYDLSCSIDKYYNKTHESKNDYIASHQGVQVVERYPQDKLMLVRMKSPQALEFESNNMGNCIKRDRYAEKLNTTAEYYSLRSYEQGKPSYPFVTMYFDNKKLVEVVGKANYAVSGMDRVNIIRSYLRRRFNLKNDTELMNNQDAFSPEDRRCVVAKRNLGFVSDKNGQYHDIYNMPQDCEVHFDTLPVAANNLSCINKEKITVDNLWLQGNYMSKLCEQINSFAHIDTLTFASRFNFGTTDVLDLSSLKGIKNLSLSNVNLRKIQKIIFPKDIESLQIGSVDFSNIANLDLRHCNKLRSVVLRNSDLRKTSAIHMPTSIETIDCSYVKTSPQMAARLTRMQTILKYKKTIFLSLRNKNWIKSLKNHFHHQER